MVRAREEGREWRYKLDPAPLAVVYREYRERFAPLWERSLGRFKEVVESGDDR